jgi:NADP-dependent 3-hydroxy acid dehydrogenase YdfG
MSSRSTNLAGLTALITGASSGIGAACARALAAHKVRLLIAARRLDRLTSLAAELRELGAPEVQPLALDVRERDATAAALAKLPPAWHAVDILINNAGLGRGMDKLYQGDPKEWDEVIDTNVKGLLYVTRAVLPGMVERQRGHVVNLGSVASRQSYPGGNVYCATKAAVRMLGECLKQDLLGSPVRVTTIEPGMVETEFSVVRFRGDGERANKVYQGMTPMTPDDIADAVLFCLTRPAHVNISEMVLLATDQAAAATVYRRP